MLFKDDTVYRRYIFFLTGIQFLEIVIESASLVLSKWKYKY